MSDDRLTPAEEADEERWDAAYHEAGHAIVATLLELPFDGAVIHEDASGVVWVSWRWPEWPLEAVMLERDIVCTMAGGWAQLLSLPEELHLDPEAGQWANESSEGDFEVAVDLARRVGYTGKAIEARLDQAKAEARRLVEANWSAIEAVAEALYERGSLTEAEVHRIVEETPEEGAGRSGGAG